MTAEILVVKTDKDLTVIRLSSIVKMYSDDFIIKVHTIDGNKHTFLKTDENTDISLKNSFETFISTNVGA